MVLVSRVPETLLTPIYTPFLGGALGTEASPIPRAWEGRSSVKGYAPTTAAGEFVRDELPHVRSGRDGAKNSRQTVAIGLSRARRAGIPVDRKPAR